MAEKSEETEQSKKRLTAVAVIKQEQLPDDDNNLNLEESTANLEGAGAASPAHSQGESSNRESPVPSCSICLDKLENKSFTDSCCHTFCFTCLLKWSNVKAVCPLCKVRFKHIIRSNDDYYQRYIGRTESHMLWGVPKAHRFSFPTIIIRCDTSRHINLLEAQENRYIFAPNSVRSVQTNHERNPQEPRNIQFRRQVYSENLWAKSVMLRSMCALPAFYQANQVYADRLVPWLTRELIVLLNNEQVGFILDFIMSLILRYSILSEEFYFHIEPHFGNNTQHFVHEFWSFANSSLEMEQYDENIPYESHNQTLASTESDVIDVESGNSENYPPDMPVSPTMQSSSSSSDLSAIREYETTRRRKRTPLTKLSLKEKFENDLWNILLSSSPPVFPSRSPPSFPGDLTLPSSLRAFSDVSASTSKSAVTCDSSHSNTTLSSEDDENDGLIVNEVKPRCMKSLEVIQISSSSESEVERALTSPLSDWELVSDGSLDLIEDGDDSDNAFVLCGSSPVVMDVSDSSKALSPFNVDELTVDWVIPCERQSRKSLLDKRDRYVPMWSRRRTSWSSSSSSRSRESKFGSYSRDRENVLNEVFGDNSRSLSPGLRFSETSELGESSRKVRMADTDWDDQYSSSSDSDTMKRNKLGSVVKKSCHRNPSDSSKRFFRSKKSKSKGKKKKKSDKHKH